VAITAERPRLDPPNILWFFGGLTAAVAGNAVVSRVHPSARGLWILLAALAFLAVFAALAAALLRTGWAVPGGVLATMAVTFVAPAAIGALRLVGFWRDEAGLAPLREYEGPLVLVALVTACAGLATFRLVRFAFVLAVVAAAVLVCGQLLLPVLVSRPSAADRATWALVVGAALVAVGVALDRSRARREAFWWHVLGLLTITAGLAYHAFRHASWGWALILVPGSRSSPSRSCSGVRRGGSSASPGSSPPPRTTSTRGSGRSGPRSRSPRSGSGSSRSGSGRAGPLTPSHAMYSLTRL
jgi:hypothetical protein